MRQTSTVGSRRRVRPPSHEPCTSVSRVMGSTDCTETVWPRYCSLTKRGRTKASPISRSALSSWPAALALSGACFTSMPWNRYLAPPSTPPSSVFSRIVRCAFFIGSSAIITFPYMVAAATNSSRAFSTLLQSR